MKVTPERTKNLRILYVITKANWGGAQRYVYDLATAALAAGHEVTVAAGMPGELVTRLEQAHVPVISIRSMGRDIRASGDIRAFAELRNVIRALRPDIVHSNSSKAGGLAAFAAKLEGVRRTIFTAHGWAFNEGRPLWQKAVIALLHYATVLLSDETICVSKRMKEEAGWMPLVQQRLHVIHNGVSPIAFYPKQEAREHLVPEFPPHTTWIGTIAELHPIKQLNVLVTAFASIASRFPDAVLVLMGEGEERARLESLIDEFTLGARVHLCGHVPEASRYLKALDVFVLPSRSEALGFVVLEAGQAALPVIASNVGGIPEVIESEVNGILVRSADAQELANALTELLSDERLRHQYATTLHARVAREFTEQDMVARTLALYAR